MSCHMQSRVNHASYYDDGCMQAGGLVLVRQHMTEDNRDASHDATVARFTVF